MRLARLTSKGIMVDSEKLHELGPVGGALAMITDLLDDEPRFYAVQYKSKRLIHLAKDTNTDDVYVMCGLPAGGQATIWDYTVKEITCKKCLSQKEKP